MLLMREKKEGASSMARYILTFKTPGGNYVYDREVNSLLSVSEVEFAAFQRIENGSDTDDDWKLLERYTEQGYLRETQLQEIVHPATKLMPFHLENRMQQISMQVTQDCNLRCSYCTYGGSYDNQRTHSKKTMSLETMKRSVDFIMERSHGIPGIYIGFYGGEPFLEIDNIKACVAYVKETYAGRAVQYTITTNGTFLNDEVIQFLQENDFALVISFDGPRDLHDMNRIYANGKGSFDDIMKNVEHIKQNYPNYFDKVSFMTVVAPNTDYSCVNDFFNANDVLSDNNITQATVNIYNAKEVIRYEDQYHSTYNYQKMKLLLAEIGLYDKKKCSKLFYPTIANIDKLYVGLSKMEVAEKSHPGGPCLPGVMRPFIDVDGGIFPCERVCEAETMQIGSLETGFDKDKVEAILNVGRLSETECKTCWCFIHCSLCVAACDDGSSRLSGEERLKYCNISKTVAMEDLASVCLLAEHGYNFEKQARERVGAVVDNE